MIDDENHYFAAGLRHCITQYALDNNKTACFLMLDSEIQPEVVIASAWRRTQRWRRASYCEEMTSVITIKERHSGESKAPCVLYRTDDRFRFLELLAETLNRPRSGMPFKPRRLTHRERQVVNYLCNGLDQSQTARVMGVSVKTVHSHKRSIMSKLMLTRHHDFIFWMLYHKADYSQRY